MDSRLLCMHAIVKEIVVDVDSCGAHGLIKENKVKRAAWK